MSNFSENAISRAEMKNVTGGCGWRCNGGGWMPMSSKSAAYSSATSCGMAGGHGQWCCASCPW